MEQTRILLEIARHDHSQAMNVLMMMQTHLISADIENIMYAYALAKDWSSYAKEKKHEAMFNMFQTFERRFESELTAHKKEIEAIFNELNPNLNYFRESKEKFVAESVNNYLHALQTTASFFVSEFADSTLQRTLAVKLG